MLGQFHFSFLRATFFAFIGSLIFIAPARSAGQTQKVLYEFVGQPNTDFPMGLTQGSDGQFYDAGSGGMFTIEGEIYKIDWSGNESVLYSFCNSGYCTDGSSPNPGLVVDEQGNIYGTAGNGGGPMEMALFSKLIPRETRPSCTASREFQSETVHSLTPQV
jgi:hypothetical protein